MLKLLAIDNQACHYGSACRDCGETFIYKSRNGLLRQLWDRHYFELEFANHVCECANRKTVELLGGVYP
jgi:hypothetical protein